MSITYSTDYVDFPYYLYDYGSNGNHTGEQEIEDEIDLSSVFDHEIIKALKEKRRLIITDMFGYFIFHAENGKIVFPKPKHLEGDLGKWIDYDSKLEIR